MRKILAFILSVSMVSFLYPYTAFSNSNAGYFVVTAYYSPLPDQNYYLTWDYKSEMRLNWKWIAWASWKKVFSWMLAWPKNYKFWTKIHLEWLWVWVIEDRWWAIVNAWNRGYSYDRIDVWVGYGDEGLRRALYWGKRTVKWNIVKQNTQTTLDYNNISAPTWVTKNFKKIPNIFNTWIGKDSDQKLVNNLKKFLISIWVYTGEMNGIYSSDLIDFIYDFQIENKLIKKWTYNWAGYWGGNTRALFLKKYLNWEYDIVEWDKFVENKNHDKWTVLENTDKYKNILQWNVTKKEDIKLLQEVLIKLWIYEWKLTWNYKDLVSTIYDFQISEGIVVSEYTPGAWSYGPKTRAVLQKKYGNYLEIEKKKFEEEERKQELEKKFKELEDLSEKKAKDKLVSLWSPKFGEVSPGVRELQKTLKELWYFDNKDTAIFWDITKTSLIDYQLDKEIIQHTDDMGAWVFGPKTMKSIEADLSKKYLNQLISVLDDKKAW